MFGKPDGRGGSRPGAGRPRKRKDDIIQRKTCNLRAFPDEWELIKRFAKAVRKDKDKSSDALCALENEVYRV